MSIDDQYIQATQELLFRAEEWLTADDLDRRLRATGSSLCALESEKQGRIFGVEHKGVHYFASYQFNPSGEPIPIIQEILQRLGHSSCWAIAAWFRFPNSWISPSAPEASPVCPKDALDRRDEVLLAAEKFGRTYVA